MEVGKFQVGDFKIWRSGLKMKYCIMTGIT